MERKTRLQFYGASISMSNVWKHFLRMVSKERTLKWLPMLWEVLGGYIPSIILHHAFEIVAGCSTLQFLVKELDSQFTQRSINPSHLSCCKIFHNYCRLLWQKCHRTDFGAGHTFAPDNQL